MNTVVLVDAHSRNGYVGTLDNTYVVKYRYQSVESKPCIDVKRDDTHEHERHRAEYTGGDVGVVEECAFDPRRKLRYGEEDRSNGNE